MAIWIGLGAAVAVAIVIAAVLLRPGDGALPSEDSRAASAVPDAAAVDNTVAATGSAPASGGAASGEGSNASGASSTPDMSRKVADPALLPVQVVRLRIGPEVDNSHRESLVAALEAAGVPEVVVEPLPFRIATSRIGYYRDADLGAAQALARVISPALGPATIGVRDYGELLTDPQPGRLDLWIGG